MFNEYLTASVLFVCFLLVDSVDSFMREGFPLGLGRGRHEYLSLPLLDSIEY